MARVIKKHDVRKKEFLNTAQELFFSRGYEQTSVEAIIKKIGLSKGSFYYYFKSKEDLLDQLTIRMSEKILKEIQKVVQREDLNATEKLNQTYQVAGNVKLKNIALMKVLLNTLYDEKNIFFRHKIFSNSAKLIIPEFSKIIQQGVAEKKFHTPYPEEAAKLIFEIANIFFETVPSLILSREQGRENIDKLVREYQVYEHFIERMIGAREDTVRIISRDVLNTFMDRLNEGKDDEIIKSYQGADPSKA